MRKIKWILLAFGVLIVLLLVGFVAYTQVATARPDNTALIALESTDDAHVTTDGWLIFTPVDQPVQSGFIFYPGGLVDPRAYAPLARDIAANGYLVVIPPMPLNLAIFGVAEAQNIIDAYPQIESWAVGGHSLGGAMASQFVKDNPQTAEGLILWGAYPAGNSDLSGQDLDVVSIYGTEDGLSTPEEIDASRPLLPPTTRLVPIEGGNHAQFGSYGSQRGDLPASISPAEQQAQIVDASVQLLSDLAELASP